MTAVWLSSQQWLLRAVHPPDGQIAPLDPVLTVIADPMTVNHGRWRLTERAHFDITARILTREDDPVPPLSDLIPEVLGLGWGPMSDNRVLKGKLRIPRGQAFTHIVSTRVIPVDDVVRRQLARLRVGEVVHLSGALVDGTRDDAVIHTSMTQNYESGACQVMLVDTVELVDPVATG